MAPLKRAFTGMVCVEGHDVTTLNSQPPGTSVLPTLISRRAYGWDCPVGDPLQGWLCGGPSTSYGVRPESSMSANQLMQALSERDCGRKGRERAAAIESGQSAS